MPQRHLVPALLLVLASSAPALDTPENLTIGGYASVIGSLGSINLQGVPPSGSGPIITPNPSGVDTTNAFTGQAALDLFAPGGGPAGAHEGETSGFTADAELRVGYALSPRLRLTLEVGFDNAYRNDVRLSQGRMDFEAGSSLTFSAGKMDRPFGWEAVDRDNLWRVNRGLLTSLYGSETVGGACAWRLGEASELALGLYNGLGLGAYADDTNVNANGLLAAHAGFDTYVGASTQVGLEVGVDPRSYDWGTSNDTATWADVLQAGLHADWSAGGDGATKVGIEGIYRRTGASEPLISGGGAFDTLGVGASLNQPLDQANRTSLTLSWAKSMEAPGFLSGSSLRQRSLNEASLAVLHRLGYEGLEALRVNCEATYRWEDGGGADGIDGDIWGVYVQVMAVLP